MKKLGFNHKVLTSTSEDGRGNVFPKLGGGDMIIF